MEWLVGAFVVLGFVAIIGRFIARDAAGRIRLPRLVDDSIGMWALRRATGRPLWERSSAADASADRILEPNAPASTRATVDTIVFGAAQHPSGRPGMVAPTRYATSSPQPPSFPLGAHVTSRTPVRDLRRRQEARRTRQQGSWLPSLAGFAAVVGMIVVALVAIGSGLPSPGADGAVLGATGRPAAQSVASPTAAAGRDTPSPSAAGAGPAATPPAATATPSSRPATTPKPRPTLRPTVTPAAAP